MRRLLFPMVIAILFVTAAPALSCGALIGARGSVQLGRTTTLAAYVDGKEHYITSFEFSGAGGEFGSIVPLPGIPEKVEKGGEWTLQRLIRETQPQPASGRLAFAEASSAEVLQKHRIDALDITIVRGGGSEVGVWAKENGFLLPPDAPEVLDFYARRSPIFMAAVFDAEAANERGQELGDGTPIHLTIPTSNPWVPLRILGLGLNNGESIQADIYLLTERKPALLPIRAKGVELLRRELASDALLADLRSDSGMEWMPATGMWLSYMSINTAATNLRFDLAADVSGRGKPSYVQAGLREPLRATPAPSPTPTPTPVASPAPSPSRPTTATKAVSDTNIRWWAPTAAFTLVIVTAGAWIVLRRRTSV